MEAAEKQWSDAQGQLHQHQALLAETRKAALAFNRELVAFRRSLRAVISTRDRDYRQLRITTRAIVGDVVDEATGDVVTEPTEPTESTSTTPSPAVEVPAPIVASPSNGAIKEVATA
ncbi:MAG TPA: hypothetical protein VGJ84_11930 [Polyangiaceae bacterium]|jgi:hypothetical protein